MQDIINDACLILLVFIMINVRQNPQWSWWTVYLFVWMGRRRVGLVFVLLLVSARGSGASSFYVARRVLEALI